MMRVMFLAILRKAFNHAGLQRKPTKNSLWFNRPRQGSWEFSSSVQGQEHLAKILKIPFSVSPERFVASVSNHIYVS